MVSYKTFTIMLAIYMFCTTTSAYDEVLLRYNDCDSTLTYDNESAYDKNLNNSLSSILTNATKANTQTFYSSTGQGPDKANAIGLCVGYVNSTLCHRCLNDVINRLQGVCAAKIEAIGWEDGCMIRYSNRTISGLMETSPWGKMYSPHNLSDTDVEEFNNKKNELISKLIKNATTGNSPSYYQANQDVVTKDLTVYAMVQCTSDISASDCSECLDSAVLQISNVCPNDTKGCRIQMPSCTIRYEADPFYIQFLAPPPSGSVDAPPPASSTGTTPQVASSPTTTIPPPPDGNGNSRWKKIVVITVSSVAVASVIVFALTLRLRRRSPNRMGESGEIEPLEALQYDFRTIEVATNHFSEDNKLGQGGFGAVYKGRLNNGQEIAVKRLSKSSGQGQTEFKNEVMLVVKLQHRNLVRLLGFCLHEEERLLVYEFVPNGSLDHCLFDPVNFAKLDYETRYKIIGGIARGLLYLHEDSRLTIIHRDLKSGNVLLDTNMNPKIADFGLAKLVQANQNFAQTSKVMGTFGYMAPEYVLHGQISVKIDVYSFGVLVLEIITGRRNSTTNTNEDDLITFVWKNWRQGRAMDIIGGTERGDAGKMEMIKSMHIGLLCIQENASDRPTMSNVVHMLHSSSITPPHPKTPSFLSHTNLSPYHHNYSSYQSLPDANESENSLVNSFDSC